MSANYDNWERLVAAVLKKQQLWELCHEHSRSPSILSEASDLSSSFKSRFSLDDRAVEFARVGSSSRSHSLFPKQLFFVSDFSPVVNFKDAYLASAELLGRGTFGAAYVAKMDNGRRFVVKRLNSMTISEMELYFRAEVVGNVKHKNVVELRAYYSTKDERLMLYDYYHKGSVYALLHGRYGDVDWESRLKIAVGAAWGIEEIHKHKLFHGNIKASNIFCNPDGYGCVSDLGTTNLRKSSFMPGSYCYAPEVKEIKYLSQASDVYSFGILLLELLTRKPSVHVPGGPQAVDLVKLVTSTRNRIMAANIFDADLLKNPIIKENVFKMLQIGIKCVEKSIEKRPKIYEVVKMLESINVLNMIMDKRLRDVNCRFKYFRHQVKNIERMIHENVGKVNVFYFSEYERVKNIGRMRHENVDKVEFFYFSEYERFLACDYYDHDTVSALLHGKLDTVRTPLDRETRLRIGVDAARGIAHIHRQDSQKLVRGNIKSIFLDSQKHAIVSYVGLAKLMNIKSPEYLDPEVIDIGSASEASDVYSFGVFLLELLSGKSSLATTDDGKVFLLVDRIRYIDRDRWTPEMFDSGLLGYEKGDEAMVQLLHIALDCVDTGYEHRPKMCEVVKMLEGISWIEPLSESGLGDTLDQQLSTESRLEDLMKDLLPTLPPL